MEIQAQTVKTDAFQMQIHVSSTQGSGLSHCLHIERPPRSGQIACILGLMSSLYAHAFL